MKLEISQDKNNASDICGHIPNFLSSNEIEHFYQIQTKQFKPAGTRYRGVDLDLRDCDRIWQCDITDALYDKIYSAVQFYNDKTYKFKIFLDNCVAHAFFNRS